MLRPEILLWYSSLTLTVQKSIPALNLIKPIPSVSFKLASNYWLCYQSCVHDSNYGPRKQMLFKSAPSLKPKTCINLIKWVFFRYNTHAPALSRLLLISEYNHTGIHLPTSVLEFWWMNFLFVNLNISMS